MSYQIGDRVRYVGNSEEVLHCGDEGTVVYVVEDSNPRLFLLSVQWDRYINGHSCGGAASKGYGWNVFAKDVELLCESPVDELFEFSEAAFAKMLGISREVFA